MESFLNPENPFWPWLLRTSAQAALLVGLVLLAQGLGRKKLPPRWRFALWWLVLARLIMPVSTESAWSIFNLARLGATTTSPPVGIAIAPRPNSPRNQPAPDGPGPAQPLLLPAVPPRVHDPAPPRPDRAELQPAQTAPAARPSRASLRNRLTPLVKVLPAVWLCGVVLLVGRILVEQLRLSQRMKSARAVNDAAILALLEECKGRIGVETPLTVIETNRVSSPALYGLFRPWLLLPEGLLQNFSRDELRHVFLHELGHVKRRDIAVNWLAAVLQVLHWFNPMVWLAFSRMRADRELACDALALSCAAPEESRAYGQTIIKLLEGFARPIRLPGLVGILEDQGQMKQRIAMIARFQKTPRWSVWALLVPMVLGLVTLTDAQSRKRPDAAATKGSPPAAAEPPAVDNQAPPSPPAPRTHEALLRKLDSIMIEEFSADNLPLGEVILQLQQRARARDPEKLGINFILAAPTAEPVKPASLDPATGLPAVAETPDLRNVTVRVLPALRNVTLREALEVVVKTADTPIKYSVETYGVILSLRGVEAPPPAGAEPPASDLETLLATPPSTRAPGATAQKLDSILIDEFSADNLPLGEIILHLQNMARTRDAKKEGVNFILTSPMADPARPQSLDPATGLPTVVEPPDLRNIAVRVLPIVRNITLREALEVVRKTADMPIQYSVESYGVVISLQGPQEAPPLYSRRFKLDPDTLRASLRDMIGTNQAAINRGEMAGGQTNDLMINLHRFFSKAGVNLDPPKLFVYKDRTGWLLVKATLQDLDNIEQIIQVLNTAPAQVQIEVKWCEIEEDANRALGFDWLLGSGPTNAVKAKDTVPVLGDMPPLGRSFRGASNLTTVSAQPAGTFPLGMTTNGLRAGTNGFKAEPVRLTGILTDPQFRVVLRALEQRARTDVLSSPRVTTLSSRQAQIKTVEVRHIVTDLDWSTNGSGLDAKGKPNPRGMPISQPFELGPVLDVVPYVGADGYTISLSVIASIKEFVGYDLSVGQQMTEEDAKKRFGAGGQAGKTAAVPSEPFPLPIFRLRQINTSAVVWDGQTLVLEGGAATYETTGQGKLPAGSPAPLNGAGPRKRLLIFVTPTIIDPAGNRVHTPEEMPFSKNAVPPQKSSKPQ